MENEHYRPAERALIVVPTYNEAGNVAELIRKFFGTLAGVEMVIVDDESPDGTAKIVEELGEENAGVHLLRHRGARGLGRAYLAGLEFGRTRGFEVIGTMDADLSHDPAHLPAMFEALPNADVVIGSRYVRDGGTVNWTMRRTFLSWTANKYAGALLQIPVNDMTSGFRLYRRGALEKMKPETVRATGYSFLVELLYRAHRSGAKIVESPIIFCDRTLGASKLQKREIYRGALNLLRLRWSGRRAKRS